MWVAITEPIRDLLGRLQDVLRRDCLIRDVHSASKVFRGPAVIVFHVHGLQWRVSEHHSVTEEPSIVRSVGDAGVLHSRDFQRTQLGVEDGDRRTVRKQTELQEVHVYHLSSIPDRSLPVFVEAFCEQTFKRGDSH